MTIEELAERAGLSPDYVNKLELGRSSPTADTLASLARALDVHVGDLFPEPGKRASAKQAALDELTAFAAQFTADRIQYLLRVAKAVME